VQDSIHSRLERACGTVLWKKIAIVSTSLYVAAINFIRDRSCRTRPTGGGLDGIVVVLPRLLGRGDVDPSL